MSIRVRSLDVGASFEFRCAFMRKLTLYINGDYCSWSSASVLLRPRANSRRTSRTDGKNRGLDVQAGGAKNERTLVRRSRLLRLRTPMLWPQRASAARLRQRGKSSSLRERA